MSVKTVIIYSLRVGYNLYNFIIHNNAIYVLYDNYSASISVHQYSVRHKT